MKFLSIALLQASVLAIKLNDHQPKDKDGSITWYNKPADVYACKEFEGEESCTNMRTHVTTPMTSCYLDEDYELACDPAKTVYGLAQAHGTGGAILL